MRTKLEKRIMPFLEEEPIRSLDELKASFAKAESKLVDSLKNHLPFPLNYASRFVDWDKAITLYQKASETLISGCGDGMLKELEVVDRARKLPISEFRQKLPELILQVYGSFDGYERYGISLQECSKKLKGVYKGEKLSLIDKIVIKPLYNAALMGLEETGQEIVEAAEEAKRDYGLCQLEKTLKDYNRKDKSPPVPLV